MSSILDAQLMIGDQTDYVTPATVGRALEIDPGETMDYKPNRRQGEGIRVGSRVARAARRSTSSSEAGGDFSLDVLGKGLGQLLRNCVGAGTSMLVSGTTYQQVFTLADAMNPFTLQKGVGRINTDASATIDPLTFIGCIVTGFELSLDTQDVLKLKPSIDAREVTTATALATASYANTGAGIFTFAGASIYSGLTTAPTATALAVPTGTPLANITDFSLAVDHQLDVGRWVADGTGKKRKPARTKSSAITGKLGIEYDSTTFRDAFLADTPMAIVARFTTPVALSTGVETLDIVLPEIRLDGELPKIAAEVTKMSCGFTALDNLTAAQPLWIVTRTSDTAL